MNQVIPVPSDINTLNREYETYIRTLRVEWLSRNRIDSRNVYEVMRPEERREVKSRIAQWGLYITPLAEAWWKERGYGVIWPADDSKPMQVHQLEAV